MPLWMCKCRCGGSDVIECPFVADGRGCNLEARDYSLTVRTIATVDPPVIYYDGPLTYLSTPVVIPVEDGFMTFRWKAAFDFMSPFEGEGERHVEIYFNCAGGAGESDTSGFAMGWTSPVNPDMYYNGFPYKTFACSPLHFQYIDYSPTNPSIILPGGSQIPLDYFIDG
jgi:hypothetical protein